MSRFAIARKAGRDYRWPAIAVALVMIAIAALDMSLYPTYAESLEDFELPDAMKGLLGEAGSITTPEGFLAAEFFGWVSLMLAVLAIFMGTGTTGGEESSGTLELLLSQPVSRARILLQKTFGLAVVLALVILASWPAFAVSKLFVDFEVSYLRLFEAVLMLVPITWLFLALSIAAGVVFPSRGAALTAVLGILVATYFVYSLGAAVDALAEVRKASPFYWADASSVMLNGTDWLRHAAFLALSALVLAGAVYAFQRRDIGATQGIGWLFRSPGGGNSAATRPAGARTATDHAD